MKTKLLTLVSATALLGAMNLQASNPIWDTDGYKEEQVRNETLTNQYLFGIPLDFETLDTILNISDVEEEGAPKEEQ